METVGHTGSPQGTDSDPPSRQTSRARESPSMRAFGTAPSPSATMAKRACPYQDQATLTLYPGAHHDAPPIFSMTFCIALHPSASGHFDIYDASTPATTFAGLPVDRKVNGFDSDVFVVSGKTQNDHDFYYTLVLFYQAQTIHYATVGYYYFDGKQQKVIHTLKIGGNYRPRWPGKGVLASPTTNDLAKRACSTSGLSTLKIDAYEHPHVLTIDYCTAYSPQGDGQTFVLYGASTPATTFAYVRTYVLNGYHMDEIKVTGEDHQKHSFSYDLALFYKGNSIAYVDFGNFAWSLIPGSIATRYSLTIGTTVVKHYPGTD
ncbi:uncharacterized protein L969DRAFT_94626 [Mixia osmundae IAM 14324]|uniref:uncharacterized protein n=1 Tax=Mixia osmundae (strain CBS 9802 / IAM 14324 / JCM 22182 / KY 12970) TaxID=764103 RepID=UPI0004A55A3C|nr:uncharacterized protein L969DRAFT_94626 [Mixia osmundae IAM 14324]KEI39571.1 hypothetical protein L969DRAFT_94626 [Mixia osmundae IAM 14324]